MGFLTLQKILPIFSITLTLTGTVTESVRATTFSPAPSFEQASSYSTTIIENNDLADVYYPIASNAGKNSLPVVLLLQGALVDKSFYSDYASQVARYGFVVVECGDLW